MILQLDIGNTRLKWRVLDGESVRARGGSIASEFDACSIKEWAITSIELSSVAGSALTERLVAALHAACSPDHLFRAVSKDAIGPLRYAYLHAQDQGVDRCLAMLASYQRFVRESAGSSGIEFDGVMVIDVGSAITIDVVDRSGQQVDGFIIPGKGLMRTALLKETSSIEGGYQRELRKSEVGVPSSSDSIGLSTRLCVDNGVSLALSDIVLGFVGRAKERGLRVFITGGDAAALSETLAQEHVEFVEELVFEGLGLAASYSAEYASKSKSAEQS